MCTDSGYVYLNHPLVPAEAIYAVSGVCPRLQTLDMYTYPVLHVAKVALRCRHAEEVVVSALLEALAFATLIGRSNQKKRESVKSGDCSQTASASKAPKVSYPLPFLLSVSAARATRVSMTSQH